MNQQKRLLEQKLKLQRGAAIIDELHGTQGAAVLDTIQDRFRADGYSNLLNKYGTTQDNSTAYQFDPEVIPGDPELISLYEGNGLFTKIIDRPAEEAVKHGLDIDYGDESIAEYVEDRLDELDFEQQFATAEKWARLYGGSIIVMLVDDGRGLEEPLDWKNVRSIEELRVFERAVVQPDYTMLSQFNFVDSMKTDRLFGEPEFYQVFSVYGCFVVHRSRCLVFRNGRMPEQTTNSIYRYWGIPEYVKIKRALRECITAHEDGVKLMERSVQAIYKMKNLAQLLATDDGENKVLQRLQIIDMARGILNSIAIDTDGEDYDFKNYSTTGVKEVIDSTCNMLSAVTNIPQTVLFGRSPAGMNSTGESDLENYYNMVENIQKQNMKGNARTLLDLILIQGVVEGKIEEIPKFKVKFAALWSMSDSEQATVDKTKADTERIRAATAQAYIDAGIIDPSEVRASLARDGYLDIEDSELPDELNLPADESGEEVPVPDDWNADADDRRESRKAAAVIVCKDGKILCAARRDKKGICGPGGHIKVGEDPEDGATRETYEEFNIYPLNLIPLGELKASTGLYLTTMLYLCDRYTGTPKADGVEMIDEHWLSVSEIRLLGERGELFPAFEASIDILCSALEPMLAESNNDCDDSSSAPRHQTRMDNAYDEWLEENMDCFRSIKEERDFARWKMNDGSRPRDATDVAEVEKAWIAYQERRGDGASASHDPGCENDAETPEKASLDPKNSSENLGISEEKSLYKSQNSGRIVIDPLTEDGGPGSGNWGHEGRPGKVGGSSPALSDPTKEYVYNMNEDRKIEFLEQEAGMRYRKISAAISEGKLDKCIEDHLEKVASARNDIATKATDDSKVRGRAISDAYKIRENDFETLVAYDKDGNEIGRFEQSGDALEVKYDIQEAFSTIHNHPGDEESSFSGSDISSLANTGERVMYMTSRNNLYTMSKTEDFDSVSARPLVSHIMLLEQRCADGKISREEFIQEADLYLHLHAHEYGLYFSQVSLPNNDGMDDERISGNMGSPEKTIDKSASKSTIKSKTTTAEDGGEGSGNHGHKGVPGQVGGSAPKGASGVTRFPRKGSKMSITSDVKMKFGDSDATIKAGTAVEKTAVFAGGGSKTPLRVASNLVKQYGGDAKNWKHTRGEATVEISGEQFRAELHWFENRTVGQVGIKVKRLMD